MVGYDKNHSGRNSSLIDASQKFASDSSGFLREKFEGKDLGGVDHNYSDRNSSVIGIS